MPKSNRHPHRHVLHPSLAALTTLAFATPAGAEPPAATEAADEPAPRYPRSVIARPLTLPAAVVAIGADAGGNHDLTEITGAPIVGYGITDELDIQVPYAFTARDFEARGSVGVDAGYVLVRGALDGKLEAVARVRAGYDTLDVAATPLQIGVHVQYNVTPWLAIISGTPGTQQLRIALEADADTMHPIDITLPVGVGVQPSETVYVQLDTRLLQLALRDSANAMLGLDTTPLALSVAWNALPALDLQGAIASDLTNDPLDALTFLIGARFYAGRL
jgi:hypothetical protein